uniref:Tubulin--tyrosine ligase-like protein 9 n=1 Tax=Tetranychus urticae TaxID=32264 RepID=T1L481_TETUR
MVYKMNSDGSIDISKLDSILTDEEASLVGKNSTQVRQALLTSGKPRVWIIGRNMESGYLRHVIESLDRIGYQRVDGFNQEWDVLWSHDYPFGKEFFTSLRPHQKVNHFPGSGYITNKVSLATTSMDHIPKAFHLPKEKDKFVEYAKNNPDRLWVKKSNNHRGIWIEKIDEINLDDSGHFVQEYIQNPLLIDGKKFDIGLYVIQTSINPLRVYIYDKDALLRWCGNKYNPFNASDFQSYVVGDDYTPIWEMPSLSKYFTELNYNMKQTLNIYLKSIGKDPEMMWNRIEEAITNVYKEKDASMARLSSMTFPESNRNFFEMVRFDFLVDEVLNVYLMEANMSSNLSSAHFAPNKLLYEQVIQFILSGGTNSIRWIRGLAPIRI